MQAFVPILEYKIVDNFFAIDSRALIFTLVISLATGLVFGLAPAWHSSNPDVVPVLKGDPELARRGKMRAFGLRNVLVVAQVALSLVVLVCGGLFIKSFRKAQTMDPGFSNDKGLIVSLSPTLVGYEEEQSRNFYKQVLERVSHVPGVEAASFVRTLPLGDSSNSSGPILKEGETLPRGSAGRNIMNTVVSPDYFSTMQIPLVEGRDFDDRDTTKTKRVIIINQRMAEMLWPGESAVGKRIFIGTDSKDPLEVVGVVKTGKYRSLAEDPKPFYYSSMDQRRPTTMALMMRPNVDPLSLVGAIRSEVQAHRSSRTAVRSKDDGAAQDVRTVGTKHGGQFFTCVWRRGDPVECRRALQRDGIRCFATHARGWDSHGARCKSRRRDEDDHATGNATRGGWRRDWVVAGARTRAGFVVAVDWYQRLRRNHVCARSCVARGSSAGGVLSARAACDEGRSTRRAAL